MATRIDEEKPLLVSIETAAKLLGISRSEAYALAARSELPTVRSAARSGCTGHSSSSGWTTRRVHRSAEREGDGR